jgi:hypothetical protein
MLLWCMASMQANANHIHIRTHKHMRAQDSVNANTQAHAHTRTRAHTHTHAHVSVMSFSSPGALGAVLCPVDGCRRRYSGRELIRHLNAHHPRVELSESQRDSVRVKQCSCGKYYSATSKGRHECFPGDQSGRLTGQKRRRTGLDEVCADGQVVAPSSAEVGAGKAGPSNRLAESVPHAPQHVASSMDAEEATATLIEESAGSSASTQEQA